MPLIKNDTFVKDPWQYLGDEDNITNETDYVIVPLQRLTKEAGEFQSKISNLGAALPNDQDLQNLKPFLADVKLVALNFPKFADGRAYSQARLIREDLGFEGELRATGDVFPDQAVSMMRCGFDAFEVSENVPLETWKRAVEILNHMYQRSYAVSGDNIRM
ncbi:MAG: DUF934 domain-containing protein [Pseudomonadota bacterium]